MSYHHNKEVCMLAKIRITHLMAILGPYPPPSFYVIISAALDIILCAFLNLICALSFLRFRTSYVHFIFCIFESYMCKKKFGCIFNVSKSHKK
jgi:hypothetical protein